MKNLIIFLYIWLLCAATARTNQDLVSKEGTVFRLIVLLGSGDYGEVWKAKVVGQNRFYAVKLFKGKEDGETHSSNIAKYLGSIAYHQPPNLLKIYEPDLYNLGDERVLAVFSEMADATVESLITTDYKIKASLSISEKIRRIENIYDLTNDLIAATEQLHYLGLVHHDVNPRNVLVHRRRHKISDMDGITAIGEPAPDGSWEAFYGPIEYGDGKVNCPELSDLYSAGSVVYFALTGRPPLEDFMREQGGSVSRRDYSDAWSTRERLKNTSVQKEYRNFIARRLAEIFEILPSSITAQYEFISKFISAATVVPEKDRRKRIAELLPNLKQVEEPRIEFQTKIEYVEKVVERQVTKIEYVEKVIVKTEYVDRVVLRDDELESRQNTSGFIGCIKSFLQTLGVVRK